MVDPLKLKDRTIARLEAENKELKEKVDNLVSFCELRNNIQSDGNEFAPSFIERIKALKE